MSNKKYFKSRYIALISRKKDSLFNFKLKDMVNMPYIQPLFFSETAHVMDSGSWSASSPNRWFASPFTTLSEKFT